MITGERLPVWALGVSLLLHMLAVVSMNKWTWLQPRPEAPEKTRYVMRLQPPAPTPVATPVAVPIPTPITPTPVVPSVQPQRPKAPAKIPKVVPKKPKKAKPPRRPKTPKKRVVQPPPPKPAPPREVPAPPPPQVAAVEPQPPTVNTKPAAPPPSAKADQDALKAYLRLVFETLEKHKRYPKYAKRRAMNGRVVLKFVVMADGRVVNPQIAKIDGHKSFRRAALQALSRAGNMPPFPDSIQRRQLSVEVPISYQIQKR